ncbi:hypothetical protein DCAR_0102778 [Daucus carota subsp. sativus]|uniref:F-box associated beta-propeller type 1 domain-containing protein n=1 Tax=Daucus carota subsp. sativus TaxID=79200 RepID=A0AAF0W5Z1_DAUCS|nr:PREDICTED: F-box protein At5g07610-like [Daucus carota subsp. sativus]WOG83601.1 hypothetical protein DCAR_0102778 [Daucus carota subsp. sativus]
MDARLKSCTSNKSRSQLKSFRSHEAVLNNEDLLTLILFRVPWTQLKVLKCVSRQWHSLITTSLPPLRASGLFCKGHLGFDKLYFVPLDDPNFASPLRARTFNLDHEKILFLHSCNGLLLCSAGFPDSYNPRNCNWYVYNPSTNQLAALPKHPDNVYFMDHIGLAFEPSKSPHYKVIAFIMTTRGNLFGDFHIYSSETGTWRVSVQSFSTRGMHFKHGVYWNGSIHWLSRLESPLHSKSSLSECLYFNVDQGRLGTFPRPPIHLRSRTERTVYFGESEDHLHVTEVRVGDTSLSVYEMKSDYSEWFVKYQIDLDPIFKVFPQRRARSFYKATSDDKIAYEFNVLSLIRRENFREDSFLVLEIHGQVIRYNLINRSFKLVRDLGVCLRATVSYWPFTTIHVWPYIEFL